MLPILCPHFQSHPYWPPCLPLRNGCACCSLGDELLDSAFTSRCVRGVNFWRDQKLARKDTGDTTEHSRTTQQFPTLYVQIWLSRYYCCYQTWLESMGKVLQVWQVWLHPASSMFPVGTAADSQPGYWWVSTTSWSWLPRTASQPGPKQDNMLWQLLLGPALQQNRGGTAAGQC